MSIFVIFDNNCLIEEFYYAKASWLFFVDKILFDSFIKKNLIFYLFWMAEEG